VTHRTDDDGGDAIQLWRVDLDRPLPMLPRPEQILTPEETNRASRFAYEVHRTRFIRARAAMRVLLGRRLGVAPHRVPLRVGSYGKPYVESRPPLAFNLSHSEGCAVIAIGGSNPFGIDVEVVRDMPDAYSVAKLVFSATELRRLREATDRIASFLKGWTRKEAVIKALGLGFSADARAFTVSLGEPAALEVAPVSAGSPRAWTLLDVSVDGQVTAIAVRAANAHVVTRSFGDQCGLDAQAATSRPRPAEILRPAAGP
jgi:4'-phosphopantetheinyl transferase